MNDKSSTKDLITLLSSTTKTVFTTQDFNKIWQYKNYKSLIQRISYLSKKGKLHKIKRGLYSIEGIPVDTLELANKLRTPSYISFETVLYREGITFQWDNRVTLATQDSREMEINNINIIFRKIKDEILLNPQGIIQEKNFHIASQERAILDMLYIEPEFVFDNLRGVDFAYLKELAKIYKRDTINKALKRLEEYARSY